ncbi:unnamed protein product [Schistosoma curassoni]|uniref:Ovule protein n=1 Tax=Schistosoma curassoni TaxID=6186 RepID=A0A183K109_9TREM|nr:unnamed protein product [Schistosoma curassoni]
MYLHLRLVDVHFKTRTQYHSLQTPLRYSLSYLSPDSHLLVQWVQVEIHLILFV